MRLLTLREIKEFTYSNLRGLAAGLIVLLVAGLILGSWLHYQFGEGWAAAAVVSLIPIHYFGFATGWPIRAITERDTQGCRGQAAVWIWAG